MFLTWKTAEIKQKIKIKRGFFKFKEDDINI